MNVGETMVKKKLKIKIASKGVQDESGGSSEMNIKVKLPMLSDSNKRAPELMHDSEREKRQKMSQSIKQQCSNILRTLMVNPSGWPFLAPVDPIQYNIPDYFTIITRPMDLGTVKAKLDGNVYFDIDEFAADVRLTFANAMKYNPPYNDFHLMAKSLDNIFSKRWKLLKGKWNAESKQLGQDCISTGLGNYFQNRRVTSFKKPAGGLANSSMPLENRLKLKSELLDLLRGKVIKKMQNALQKFGLVGLKEEKVKLDLDKYNDETLLELKRVVGAYCDSAAQNAEPVSVKQSGGCLATRETVHKDSSTSSCRSANTKQPANIVASRDQSADIHAILRNLPTKRKLERDHSGVAKRNKEVTNSLESVSSKSDLNSQGDRGISYEENSCSSASGLTCASTATYGEEVGWDSFMNIELSPTKALRAAMLKSRFADTIIKAKQKSFPKDGDKSDLQRLQQETVQLEKQQLEERARIVAAIKAAEVASQRKAEAEQKMQREREREAARIAIQKMEKTVEFEDNLKILRDLEKLCKCCSEVESFIGHGDGFTVIFGGNPLERLGLFIKEDYFNDDEDAILNGDWEDGEILS